MATSQPQTSREGCTYGQVIHDLLAELRPEDPAAYARTMKQIAVIATAATHDPD